MAHTSLPIAIVDYAKQATQILKHQLFYDRGIWRWCSIFAGLYIGSRLFFYRFYYPKLVRAFSPPSFFQSESPHHNIDAKQHLSKQSSISNAFPQSLLRRISVAGLHSDSLYSQTARWSNSEEASAKLMSLVHAILTAYKGLNCIRTLNLTAYTISRGIDYIPKHITADHPLILQILNMNISYAFVDLCLVESQTNWRGNIPMLMHHVVVVLGGIAIKYYNRGCAIWIFGYAYADIPTVMLHSAWFARNIGINLKSLFALFNKTSVKESAYLEGHDDIVEDIHSNINMLNNIEKVLFVGFSASFLYIRCILFSKVFLGWIWNGAKSEDWGSNVKVMGGTITGSLIAVGYWWSFKVVRKIYEIFSTKEIAEEAEEEEVEAILPRFNQTIKRLSSVDEQQSQP